MITIADFRAEIDELQDELRAIGQERAVLDESARLRIDAGFPPESPHSLKERARLDADEQKIRARIGECQETIEELLRPERKARLAALVEKLNARPAVEAKAHALVLEALEAVQRAQDAIEAAHRETGRLLHEAHAAADQLGEPWPTIRTANKIEGAVELKAIASRLVAISAGCGRRAIELFTGRPGARQAGHPRYARLFEREVA